MIAPLQKYKVTIFGEPHSLISDDSEQLVTSSVQLVDALMKEVALKTGSTDVKQLAILVALHLAQQKLNDQFKMLHLIDIEL